MFFTLRVIPAWCSNHDENGSECCAKWGARAREIGDWEIVPGRRRTVCCPELQCSVVNNNRLQIRPRTLSEDRLEIRLIRIRPSKAHCFKFAPLEFRQTAESVFVCDRKFPEAEVVGRTICKSE
jgi:hypothetical protein